MSTRVTFRAAGYPMSLWMRAVEQLLRRRVGTLERVDSHQNVYELTLHLTPAEVDRVTDELYYAPCERLGGLWMDHVAG